jgi:hypothetical protein
MPRYIIERQYLVPMFEHILVEAPDLNTACRRAVDGPIEPWGEDAELCFDDARATTVSCAAELPEYFEPQLQEGKGDESYVLSSLLYCSDLEQLPIPEEFTKGDDGSSPGVGFV